MELIRLSHTLFLRRRTPVAAFLSNANAGGGPAMRFTSSCFGFRCTIIAAFMLIFSFFAATLLYKVGDPLRIGPLSLPTFYRSNFTLVPGEPQPGAQTLEEVLMDAAMDDRTVILTTLNEAWASPNSIFDLFLNSFRNGNGTRKFLDHLVVIALDEKAFAYCLAVHVHCFALVTEGIDFSHEAYFMTPDYLKMMWRRIEFLRSVLKMGYNLIFTDADVMWFRDPFPQFHPDADFQIACDHFVGDPSDKGNRVNGGFLYARSNDRTIKFYEHWYTSRETYPGLHDQDVLNNIKGDAYIAEIGLGMKFLDTAYFGGFCEPSKDLNKVCTMHANCCYGMESKLYDLRVLLEDWKQYLSLPQSVLNWNVPAKCRLDDFTHPEEKTATG